MTRPQKRKAPAAMARPEAQENTNDTDIIVALADAIKVRIQAGEIVGALDYSEPNRSLFWSAIARVRDDMPCVRPIWRTISEQHVDGLRTRQKMFRICPRQRGLVDSTLAGLIAFVVVCIGLLSGWFG